MIQTALMALLSLGFIGCSATSGSREGTHSTLGRLQPGMTYAQVRAALSSVDPEIDEVFAEIREEEREAQKDARAALDELRSVGIDVAPPIRSRFTIDRGDYLLKFENGRLIGWSSAGI
jgi:hypothetical protein